WTRLLRRAIVFSSVRQKTDPVSPGMPAESEAPTWTSRLAASARSGARDVPGHARLGGKSIPAHPGGRSHAGGLGDRESDGAEDARQPQADDRGEEGGDSRPARCLPGRATGSEGRRGRRKGRQAGYLST